MIPQEYFNYGLTSIPEGRPDCFRVYKSQNEYEQISCNGQPIEVRWSGSTIMVEMENGDLRMYHDLTSSGFELIQSEQRRYF